MDYNTIIQNLMSMANRKNVEGMVRFGINPEGTLGISVYTIRKMAKELPKDHILALQLWASGIHEARILAALIDNPEEVTPGQMESWVKDFDSWDVCDQVCSNLFDKTEYAYSKAIEWSQRDEEFVRRAGFVLMCALSVHNPDLNNDDFLQFFPYIKDWACDGRNFVMKAVNWAIRQIGKRNMELNKECIKLAEDISKISCRPASWISSNALRELKSEKVQKRLKKKK